MRIDRKKMLLAMLDKDINSNELSELSSLSRATISGIKCGKSCSPDTIQKVAKALNIDESELIASEI